MIPTEASTIHRALGVVVAGGSTRYRRHRGRPLVTDLLLVDEASMVDLALMERLLDALPPHAGVILLGDRDQLASVEAGAVLGDICDTGTRHAYSAARAAELAELTGETLTPAVAAPPAVADCIVQLEHSYRYGADSGIAALAGAINAGAVDAVFAVLGDDAFPDVRWVEPHAGAAGLDAFLGRRLVAGLGPVFEASAPAEALARLDRFRVLCAVRHGERGVPAINRRAARLLRRAGLVPAAGGERYAGRPLLIGRNDYQLGLFNGDVGVLWPVDGELRACFADPRRGLRTLATVRLPDHETVFAMTVHKSQGSEMDEVVVVLPAAPSGLLSRELLYTAVTRARQGVTLYAERDVLTAAVRHPVRRQSGLRDVLWEPV